MGTTQIHRDHIRKMNGMDSGRDAGRSYSMNSLTHVRERDEESKKTGVVYGIEGRKEGMNDPKQQQESEDLCNLALVGVAVVGNNGGEGIEFFEVLPDGGECVENGIVTIRFAIVEGFEVRGPEDVGEGGSVGPGEPAGFADF